MIYPSIDKLLQMVDSKYRLVHIASERSHEMSEKGLWQKCEKEYHNKKNIGRALEEVAEGLIIIKKD